MGSLRNPIGPLPSSIYWRRRAVALAVLALLVLLVVWAFSLGGPGGGSDDNGQGSGGGSGPASSITPGPSGSGPAISERPGGRDDSGGGPGGGGASGGDAGADDSPGGDGSSGWEADDGSGTGGTAEDGSGDGAGGGGDSGAGNMPAGSGLPGCATSDVTVALRSVEKEYGPEAEPKFELTAENDGDSDCSIDLGRTATVVTIIDPDDEKFWASDDCPAGAEPLYARVPAGGESVHTLTWLRRASDNGCGTAPTRTAKPGTYEIEADVEGLKTVRTTFELKG